MTTYLDSLRRGLLETFEADPRVVLLGEDVLDPYGGAFKVTLGLSTRFPGRVIATPISEAGFTGLAAGMAMRGLRPIVEIMFGDFLTLCTDQIVNHITKFSRMYDGVKVPLVIRTPMGGGRGYGATHSQSIEKMYLGVTGLNVVAPSIAHNPGRLLRNAVISDENPVLFVENKALYGQDLYGSEQDCLHVTYVDADARYPIAVVRNRPEDVTDVSVIAYGGASRHVLGALIRLADEEISAAAVFPSLIRPLSVEAFVGEIDPRSNILIVEEGCAGFNWGSEVAAQLYEFFFDSLRRPIRRLASADAIIPCAEPLEKDVLVTEEKIEQAIMEMLV